MVITVPGLSAEENKSDNKSEDGEKLVNRRVLILKFVNQTNNPDYDYLSATLADGLVGPLQYTKKFFVENVDKGERVARKLNIPDQQLAKEEQALNIAREAGVDVVVIGKYIQLEGVLQIQAKALEVRSGRIAVSQEITGKVDGTIFVTIATLMNNMSSEMKDKLKPIPQREVLTVADKESTIGAVLRSAIWPGWGQHYWNSNAKAWTMYGVNVALFGATAFFYLEQNSAFDSYMDVKEGSAQSDFDSKYTAYQDKYATFQLFAVLSLSYYTLNLLDAYLFRGASKGPLDDWILDRFASNRSKSNRSGARFNTYVSRTGSRGESAVEHRYDISQTVYF